MPAQNNSPPPRTCQDLYGLSKSPFAPDAALGDYIVFSTHRRVFDAVLNHLLTGTGIMLLTGEQGIGKTAMLRAVTAMANQSGRETRLLTRPPGARIIRAELAAVAAACQAGGTPTTPPPRGLLIDDIDLLPTDTAHALLTLLRDSARPAAIVLTSSTAHLAETARADLAPLMQSLSGTLRLPPLTTAEICQYIERLLWMAGGTTRRLISSDALRAIAARAHGAPATANQLMEAALLAGLARQDRIITARTIAAVLAPIPRRTPSRARPPSGARPPPRNDTAERMVRIAALALLVCGISVFTYKAMQAPSRHAPGQTTIAGTR